MPGLPLIDSGADAKKHKTENWAAGLSPVKEAMMSISNFTAT